MYTLYKIADTSQMHHGFWFAVFAFSIIVIFFAIEQYRDWSIPWCATPLIAIVLGLALWGIHGKSYEPAPVNIPVVAKFVGFTSEDRDVRNGKYTRSEHYLYANFKTARGNIAIDVAPGTVIPDNVILYWN